MPGINVRDLFFRRERQIKSWTRAKKEALVAGSLEELRRISRGQGRWALRQAQGSIRLVEGMYLQLKWPAMSEPEASRMDAD